MLSGNQSFLFVVLILSDSYQPARKKHASTPQHFVIYLKQTTSELVYQTSFMMERTRHEFDVIRLWEQPASVFLQYPGLIPFAVLGESEDATETLRQATQTIDRIANPITQANLMAASGILAGLKLSGTFGFVTKFRFKERKRLILYSSKYSVIKSIFREWQEFIAIFNPNRISDLVKPALALIKIDTADFILVRYTGRGTASEILRVNEKSY